MRNHEFRRPSGSSTRRTSWQNASEATPALKCGSQARTTFGRCLSLNSSMVMQSASDCSGCRVADSRFTTGTCAYFLNCWKTIQLIFVTVFQTCKRPDTDDIAIAADHRRRFLHMLGFIAVHDHTFFHFQSPTVLAYVHRNHIQAKVLGSFLGLILVLQLELKNNRPMVLFFPSS